MSTLVFTIEHQVLPYGPFPKGTVSEISKDMTVEVEKINVLSEKVTFTINNKNNEDPLAIAYELGCAIQSILDHKLFS